MADLLAIKTAVGRPACICSKAMTFMVEVWIGALIEVETPAYNVPA
jgi:hypothetical protein